MSRSLALRQDAPLGVVPAVVRCFAAVLVPSIDPELCNEVVIQEERRRNGQDALRGPAVLIEARPGIQLLHSLVEGTYSAIITVLITHLRAP